MVRKISWFAFVFGMFFPIIGVFAELYSKGLEVSMSNITLVSKESLTLQIVYSAPIVLSFVAYLLSKFYIRKIINSQKKAMLDRTNDFIQSSTSAVLRLNEGGVIKGCSEIALIF